jgi:hypothetical protein
MPDPDLFHQPRERQPWTPATETRQPLIYLRNLWLLESLAPGVKPLREVPFRAGLNVVWADPRTEDARKGRTRVAGHAAGKTTLCRILRWLLGEGHFAPPELETRIAVDLKDGWAVLALELDGQPWLVGRPFFHKAQHAAAPGLTLEDLQRDGWPDGADAKAFLAELERLTVGRFEQKRFPGRDSDITWTQLLAWLARDQETALNDVALWRSAVKTPGERGPTAEERHLLLRLVLDMLGKPEMGELQKSDAWEKKRKTEKDSRDALVDRLGQACLHLAPLVPRDGEPLKGELLLGPARKAVNEKTAQLARMREALKTDDSITAERIYRQAHAALAEARRDVKAAERVREAKQEQFDRAANATLEAEKQIKQVALSPAPGFCCASPEEAATAECKAFRPQPLDFDLEAMLATFKAAHAGALTALQAAQEEVKEKTKALPVLEQNDKALAQKGAEARRARELQVANAARLAAELETQTPLAESAEKAHTALVACDAAVKSLSDDLTTSRGLRRTIRTETHLSERMAFGKCYEDVLAFLLGPDTGGAVEFGDEGELVLQAWSRAPMSSGAIDALEVVAFDLATMLWAVLGRGHHPRLLIHDSPKVADMSPALYEPLFDLAVQAERDAAGAPTFQYILTTTEPPPPNLKEGDEVILKLDASEAGGRLFKRDFKA